MKYASIVFLSLISSVIVNAQIATVDIIKARAQYEKEAMYFFEQNWKPFREEALKLNHISGFQLIKTAADSTGLFNIVLITQFSDSTQFKKVEENFRPIMKRLSPTGPRMLNGVTRKEFIESGSGLTGTIITENRKVH